MPSPFPIINNPSSSNRSWIICWRKGRSCMALSYRDVTNEKATRSKKFHESFLQKDVVLAGRKEELQQWRKGGQRKWKLTLRLLCTKTMCRGKISLKWLCLATHIYCLADTSSSWREDVGRKVARMSIALQVPVSSSLADFILTPIMIGPNKAMEPNKAAALSLKLALNEDNLCKTNLTARQKGFFLTFTFVLFSDDRSCSRPYDTSPCSR